MVLPFGSQPNKVRYSLKLNRLTCLVVRKPHGELDGDDLDEVLNGVEPRQLGRRVGHHDHAVDMLVIADAQSEKRWLSLERIVYDHFWVSI